MPINDYDREKTLQATSFNDSGATVDKAQPVILRGNDFTGVDGFESGSSQLGFESNANITVDSNGEIFGDDSLKISSSNFSVEESANLVTDIGSDGKRLSGSIKIDSQTGNSSDSVTVTGEVGTGFTVAEINFVGNGDVTDVNGAVVDSWSAGTIIDFELVFDFTNDQYDIVIDDSTVASDVNFSIGASKISDLVLVNDTSASGSTVNAFFDRLTYTSPVEDSINAGGFIGYDSSTVTDAQDVAFYDQNDTLLPYELENPGDLGSSSTEVTAWVYRSYTRDDSNQVKFAYGNNSQNVDRQDVEGTWNNTGQNAAMVQHLNQDFLDSTSNNRDYTNVTGTTDSTGQFNGAKNFDGADDDAVQGSFGTWSNGYTMTFFFKTDTDITQQSVDETLTAKYPDSSAGEFYFRLNGNNNDLRLDIPFVEGGVVSTSTTPSPNTWYHAALTYDGGSTYRLYLDAVEEGVNTSGSSPTDTNTDIYLGSNLGSNYWDGDIDHHNFFLSEAKSSDWVQADYDASPKAGQVFFTQDAAQDTAGALTATVTDSFDLTEDTSFLLKFTASDNLTVQENEEGTLSDLLDDNVAFNENIRSTIITSLTDQLGFAEDASRKIFQDVSDQLGFSEDINATLALSILVSDSLQFAENIDSELRDALRDDIQLNENVESRLIDSLADQIGFTEFVQPAISQLLQDDLGFNEAAATQIQDQITEQLTLSENIESQLNDILSRQLDFTEETAEALADNFTDQLQFQEEVINIVDETLRDDIGFSEEVSSLITRQLSDQLSFQDQVLFASLLNIEGLTEAIIKKPNRFVTMQNRTFKQGDLGDELQATLRDKNGKIDLSQISSVDFVARDTKKNKVLDEQVTISDPANGVIQYQWRQGDFIEDDGVYQAEFRINDNAGNTETVPNDGYVTIEIEEEIQ